MPDMLLDKQNLSRLMGSLSNARDYVRWVMYNMPVEFVLHEECPVDRLMHVQGVLAEQQTVIEGLMALLDEGVEVGDGVQSEGAQSNEAPVEASNDDPPLDPEGEGTIPVIDLTQRVSLPFGKSIKPPEF